MTARMKRLIEIEREMAQLLADAKRVRVQLVSGVSGFAVSKMASQVSQDIKTLAALNADALLRHAAELTEMVTRAQALVTEQRELDAASDE